MNIEYYFMKSGNGVSSMANLQIKGIDDDLYREIREMAKDEHRSVSQQILTLFHVIEYSAYREFRNDEDGR